MCAQQKKIITCVWGLHSTGRIRWVGVYISFQKIRLRSLTTTTRKTTKNTINNISSLSVFPSFPFSLSRKKKNLLSHAKHTQITSSSWILEIAKSPSKALPNRTLPRVLSLVCRKAKDAEATTSPYALHCLGRDCKIVVAAAIAVAAAVVIIVVVVVALAPFRPLSSCEINFQRLLRSSSRVDKVGRGGKEKTQ